MRCARLQIGTAQLDGESPHGQTLVFYVSAVTNLFLTMPLEVANSRMLCGVSTGGARYGLFLAFPTPLAACGG